MLKTSGNREEEIPGFPFLKCGDMHLNNNFKKNL